MSRDTGLDVGVRFSDKQEFSLYHNVQSGSGAHPASYSVGIGSLLGGKPAGEWS
jgi:hypothetical protein